MNRSIRSIPGAAKYPADTFGTRGRRYVGISSRTARSVRPISNVPLRSARGHAALDVQDVAARQHHGDRAHPVARRPVFEGRRAGGVGRDDAADERAGECWRRRIVLAGACQRGVEIEQRDTGFDADRVGPELEDAIHPRRAQEQVAHRRCAAGQRRLRADRQHAGGGPQDSGDLAFIGRRRDSRGVAAWEVRGIFEERPHDIRVAADLARDDPLVARPPRSKRMARHRRRYGRPASILIKRY